MKRAEKVQEFVDKVEENQDTIKFWSKKVIALVAFTILMVMAYNNGAFEHKNWSGDQLPEGLFSIANITAMGKELTTFAVVVTLYILARRYNEKLDREEQLA